MGEGMRISPKQMKVLTWWQKDKWEAIICDGAVRSGKTFAMGLSFFLWAERCFSGKQFGLCGKTIGSLRRNLLAELVPYLRNMGMTVRERRSENLLVVQYKGHENRFLLFGGRDEFRKSFFLRCSPSFIFLTLDTEYRLSPFASYTASINQYLFISM